MAEDKTHEIIMSQFYQNRYGILNITDLFEVDCVTIKSCIEQGYSLKDIHLAAMKFLNVDFKGIRYETIRNFINDFEINRKELPE